MIVRLAAGGGALLALGGCGSAGSSGADGPAGRSEPSMPGPVVIVSTTTGGSVSTPGSSTVVTTTVASSTVASSTAASSTSGRTARADVRVDGGTISVEDDGAGALVVTSLVTQPDWAARVDDTDPTALVVELTAPGRRTIVDIRLTADGITTSTRAQAVSGGSSAP